MVKIMADVFADLEPSIPLNTSQALCPESPSVSLMRQLLSVRLCFSGDKAPAGVHGLSGVGLRAGAQVSDAESSFASHSVTSLLGCSRLYGALFGHKCYDLMTLLCA